MKITGKTFFLLLILTCSCSLFRPCRMNKMITGYWKPDSIVFNEVRPEMQNEINKNTVEMMQGSFIIFMKKNHFEYSLSEYSGQGTWKFTDNFRQLYFSNIFSHKRS